jgi:hypothetical protein
MSPSTFLHAALAIHAETAHAPTHGILLYAIAFLAVSFAVIALAVNELGRRGLIGPPDATIPMRPVLTGVLAGLSAGAAAIHFAMTGPHFEEDWLYGLFFIVAAWAQAVWAGLYLVLPVRAVAVLGLVGNVVIIGTWAVTRTVGVPFGPLAAGPEAIGGADLAATGFELLIVVLLLVVLSPLRERFVERRRLLVGNALLYGSLSIVGVGIVTTMALLGTSH